jgi:aminoglycoside phosphotransferase (APT) family kinase protein
LPSQQSPTHGFGAHRNELGLDEEAVSGWIRSIAPQTALPLTFRRIGTGKSNITVAVSDSEGGRWVLRRPPPGPVLASAHDVEREHRILSALSGTDVPTPKSIGLTTDAAVCESPLLLMEYLDGMVLDSTDVAENLTPEARRRVSLSVAESLALVHAVDLDASGLSRLASSRPYAQRQLWRWLRQWEASQTRQLPLVEELAARFGARIPEQHETTLVHGDYHLANLLIDPGTASVVGVLDWELSTTGDPLADLGGLLAYWAQVGDPPGSLYRASTLSGFQSRDELVAAYASAAARDTSAVGFWHALGLWKIAVIVEGVRRRALDDSRNAARGATFSDGTSEALLEQAWLVADAAGL